MIIPWQENITHDNVLTISKTKIYKLGGETMAMNDNGTAVNVGYVRLAPLIDQGRKYEEHLAQSEVFQIA